MSYTDKELILKNHAHQTNVASIDGNSAAESGLVGAPRGGDKQKWVLISYEFDGNKYFSISPSGDKHLFVGIHGVGRESHRLLLTPVRFLWKIKEDGAGNRISTLNGDHSWSLDREGHSILLQPKAASHDQLWVFE